MFLKPVSKKASFRNPFECYNDWLKVQKKNKSVSLNYLDP
jgi:hypothetical protein